MAQARGPESAWRVQAQHAAGRKALLASGATEMVTCSTGNHGAAVAWASPAEWVPRSASGTTTITRVGVVASAMPVMADSFAAGQPVPAPVGKTIADGLAVRVADPLAVTHLRHAVDVMLRVSERDIAAALVAYADGGIEIEPSAAAALAAVRPAVQHARRRFVWFSSSPGASSTRGYSSALAEARWRFPPEA
jgi:threonine dehydratase